MNITEWTERTRTEYVEPPRELIDAALRDLPTAWLNESSRRNDVQSSIAVESSLCGAGHLPEAANWAVMEAVQTGLLIPAEHTAGDCLWLRASDALWKTWRLPEAADSPATHGPDFRSVNWYGRPYAFTATQAACVGMLWEAWRQGTPDVGDATLLESAGSHADRLPMVFRDHDAWGTMIVNGSTKGTHRLAEPSR